MKFQQIRNATVKIEYAGSIFLVDPWLAPKGSMGTFRDFPMFVPNREEELDLPMPMTELPARIEDILSGLNAVILTHIHPDHVDMAPDGTIGALLPKELPVFCQSGQTLKSSRLPALQRSRCLDRARHSALSASKSVQESTAPSSPAVPPVA